MIKSITLAGLCLALAVLGKTQTITVFEVPGATATWPNGILPTGDIIGNWADSTGNNHGFIRQKHGGITTFDVPGS